MKKVALVINAGSSSIKFALYQLDVARLLARGQVSGLGGSQQPSWEITISNEAKQSCNIDGVKTHLAAIEFILDWVSNNSKKWQLVAAGHRVVHGGTEYSSPVRVTSDILAELRQLQDLAPQHQPHNLSAIDAVTKFMPELMQVACFDTAFHTTQPEAQQLLPLPKRLRDKGLMKYGFHGLSYEYLVDEIPSINSGQLPEKLIIAHLGNGASACAIYKGKSMATTMGFSTLDGIVMGTRCGAMDPGVLLHLLQKENLTVEQLSDCLYEQSGLLGLSGISSDIRQLEASSSPQAELALEVYVSTLAKHIAGLAAVLQGFDAIVFSGGVGENSVFIREKLLSQLAWLGCELDTDANHKGLSCITTPDSQIQAFVVPTNEELVILRYVIDLYTHSTTATN